MSKKDGSYGLFDLEGNPIGLAAKSISEIHAIIDSAEKTELSDIVAVEIRGTFVVKLWRHIRGWGWHLSYQTGACVTSNYDAVAYGVACAIEARLRGTVYKSWDTPYRNAITRFRAAKAIQSMRRTR